MKAIKLFILILIILSNLESRSQQFLSGDNKSLKLYKLGTSLIEQGKYQSADSVLTLVLNKFKNEDIYYNRGIARLYKGDTCAFCEDMNIAANKYFDDEARKLSNRLCCFKVDTIYYDKKFNISNQSHYKYLEETQYKKSSNQKIVLLHELDAKVDQPAIDFGSDGGLVNFQMKLTDIIAEYYYIDSVKYYYSTTKPAYISNKSQYDDFKEKAKLFLSAKYQALKDQNSGAKLSVYVELKISPTGEITDGKFLAIFPELKLGDKETDLKNDILNIIRHYPKATPASFKGKKVHFIANDYIDF